MIMERPREEHGSRWSRMFLNLERHFSNTHYAATRLGILLTYGIIAFAAGSIILIVAALVPSMVSSEIAGLTGVVVGNGLTIVVSVIGIVASRKPNNT